MEFLDTDFFFNIFWYLSHSCSLSTTCFPPTHTSHLCLAHVYPHFLFYFFLSISLHSVLSPYLHSSLPFHLTCSFYLRHIFLLERKKKLKSKTVDLPRCFALSYKIPKSTRFFFLFTFQYQRLAQEFSGSKN